MEPGLPRRQRIPSLEGMRFFWCLLLAATMSGCSCNGARESDFKIEGPAPKTEAQFESGEPQQAVQSAEQGLQLDPSSEACRVQLSRVRLAQGNLDASFAAIAPAV